MENRCSICSISNDFKVEVIEIKSNCRYHKKIGQKYILDQLAPKGLCPQLFYSTYPSCLSCLYSRSKNQKHFINCPENDGVRVSVQIIDRLPIVLLKLKAIFDYLINFFNITYDVPLVDIQLEIVSKSEKCPYHFSVGDKFKFNMWNKKELCPAAFSSIYPFLKCLDQKKFKNIEIQCPDHKGIVFGIDKNE